MIVVGQLGRAQVLPGQDLPLPPARLRPPGLGPRPQGRVRAAGAGARLAADRARARRIGSAQPDHPRRRPSRAQLSLLRSVVAAALRRELSRGGRRAAGGARTVNEEPARSRRCRWSSRRCCTHARRWCRAGRQPRRLRRGRPRQAALALQRLCEGDLRGMFDGPTTPGLDLDAPLVVLDLSAVQDSAALGILMTCAAAWLQASSWSASARPRRRRAAGAKMIVVVDEAWRITAHLGRRRMAATLLQALPRAQGCRTSSPCTACPTCGAAGAQGSREARIAEGLIADADTKVIYAPAARSASRGCATCWA